MFSLMPWRRVPAVRETAPRAELPLRFLRGELDELFERLMGRWPLMEDWPLAKVTPMEIEEAEKEYVVKADLPGFEPNEMEVLVNGDVLTVKAEHVEPKDKEAKDEARTTRRVHETLLLPADAEREKVAATYRNGVLEVRLERKPASVGRRIEVTT